MSVARFGLGVIAASIISVSAAHSAVLTDSYSAWASSAGGTIYNTTALGIEYDPITTVNLNGGGSFTSDNPAGYIATVGDGWATWSGGYTGQVIANVYGRTATLSLSGLKSFGFEVEPNDLAAYDVTVTLSDGSSLTDSVDGNGGAQFFGFTGGGISSVSISTTDSGGFAYGNFYSVAAVPLPASAPMFGAALMALGAAGYAAKRKKAAAAA